MKYLPRLTRILMFSVILVSPLAAAQKSSDQDPVVLEQPATITAAQWGSNPERMPKKLKHTPAFITIHHAGVLWKAGSDPAAKAKGLQSFGKREKNWPDLPYHYLIAPNGTIYEGRLVKYRPATNTSYDVEGHIGIQLWGNFEVQRVSPQQMDALVALTAWLLQEHQLDTDTIGGHLDRTDTACPGRDLDRYIQNGALIEWVDQAAVGQSPDIELGEPLANGPTDMIPDAGDAKPKPKPKPQTDPEPQEPQELEEPQEPEVVEPE